MSSNLLCLSQFCALYSTVGMLFMLMVAMMLTYQPFLILGIKDHEKSKSTAYGALITFGVTFVASVIVLLYERGNEIDALATSSSSSSSASNAARRRAAAGAAAGLLHQPYEGTGSSGLQSRVGNRQGEFS